MNEFDASSSEHGLTWSPMSVSQVINRVGKILRGNVIVLLKLGTVPAGAMLATYALAIGGLFAFGALPAHPGTAPDPQRVIWATFPIILLACIPILLAYALFEAAASVVALAANRGEARSFRQAYGAAWANAGRIVWLMILRYLIIMLPMMVLFGVIAGVAALQAFNGGRNVNPGLLFVAMPFLVLAYAGSFAYVVWMVLRLGLAVPACLAEEKTAAQALRRSTQLTRGSKGRIFLVMLLVYAISCAAILVMEMVAMGVGGVVALIASGMHLQLTQPWTMAGAVIFAIVIFAAFLLLMTLSWACYVVAFSVLYDDQRLRLEGAARVAMSGGRA